MGSARSRFLVLASLAACVIWGCSALPTAPTTTPHQTTTPTRSAAPDGLIGSTSLLASKLINGAVGGVVGVGDWKVVVPAGAFSGTAVITVKVPDSSVRQCDLDISPASLNNFKIPVALWCNFRDVSLANDSSIMWWDPGAEVWRVIPSTPLLTNRIALLPHFSTYKGGRAGW